MGQERTRRSASLHTDFLGGRHIRQRQAERLTISFRRGRLKKHVFLRNEKCVIFESGSFFQLCALEGRADQLFHGGFGAGLVGGCEHDTVGIDLFVAEGDEGEDGIA